MFNGSRSFLIILARLVPVLLVVGLSVVWSQEKGIRLQLQNQFTYISEKLSRTEQVNAELRSNLEVSLQNEERIKSEKLELISQLGQRDEHIRRLLSEMVQILSGGNAIDLGRLTIRGKEEVWSGSNKEPKVATAPSINNFVQTKPPVLLPNIQLPKIQPVYISPGSAQVQMEERLLPANPPIRNADILDADLPLNRESNISIKNHVMSPINKTIKVSGEIFVVNQEHNFVVVNRGIEHYLREGDVLQVYRDEKRLGTVQIETAYHKISAATVIQGLVEDFKTGDGVVGV